MIVIIMMHDEDDYDGDDDDYDDDNCYCVYLLRGDIERHRSKINLIEFRM